MIPERATAVVRCPSCGEPVALLVDTSVSRQTYVEDCQVCCRPMVVEVDATGAALSVAVEREDA